MELLVTAPPDEAVLFWLRLLLTVAEGAFEGVQTRLAEDSTRLNALSTLPGTLLNMKRMLRLQSPLAASKLRKTFIIWKFSTSFVNILLFYLFNIFSFIYLIFLILFI